MINSFLKPWLDGKYSLPSPNELRAVRPDIEDGWWISVNDSVPFYKVMDRPVLGLVDAWKKNWAYYESAVSIAHEYDGYTLEHEDRCDILDVLGEPPDVSHPLYLITVRKDGKEQLMYVGKSSSSVSRFASGHSIAIKLLSPEYDGFEKLIYFVQVMLYNNEFGHLPLEFLGDQSLAEQILDDTESKLIYHLQPVLNVRKKKILMAKFDFTVLIENSPGFISHSSI